MPEDEKENNTVPPRPKNALTRLGVFLIAASFILYGGVLLVPFTSWSTGAKVAVGTALAVSGEVSFWVGGIILGKEVLTKYKRFLNPLSWFRRKGH